MLKYFALTAVLLQIQIGSVYASNSDIHKGLKDEQSYQLNFQKLKQGKISSQAKFYYSQARDKSLNKDYKGAILDYTQAIKIDPNYADAYRGRGLTYYHLDDYQKAILDYTQAIKINPNYADAYRDRGFIYYLLKNYQKAMNDLNQAIKINPNDGLAYLYRSQARAVLGDIQGFTEDGKQSDVNMLKARHNSSGETNFLLGNYEIAIAECTQAIKIDPNYAKAYYNRGKSRSELGDKQVAIVDFTQAIKINPNDSDIYRGRGISRSELGDKQGAIVDFTQAIKINPNDAMSYSWRGMFRSELGDKQGAIADYNQAANFFLEQGDMEIYLQILQNIRRIQGR